MRAFWLAGTALPVLALGAATLADLPVKLVYNASESAPIGFYLVADRRLRHGDLALVHVPEEVRDLIEKRGYLPPDVPLIKRVVGLVGDEICRTQGEIFVDGRRVAFAQTVDQTGGPLPVWQGCETLSADRIFLLQDHPLSFDGRYFGPVDQHLIIGRATHLRLPWWCGDES